MPRGRARGVGWPPPRRSCRHAPRRLRPSARPLGVLAAREHGAARGAGRALPGRARCRRWRSPTDANLFGAMQFCAAAKQGRRAADHRRAAADGAARRRSARRRAASRRRSCSCCWSRTRRATQNLLQLMSRAYLGGEAGGASGSRCDDARRPRRRPDRAHRRPRRARSARRCGAATPSCAAGPARDLEAMLRRAASTSS